VRDSANALLTIINDILDFSQLDAGKMKLNVAAFNLRETILEVNHLLGPQARAKGLEIALQYADDAPARLLGDVIRIRQVLINLIGNAIKFTERGGIAVAVACVRKSGGEAWMELAVEDTGIGIPDDKLQLIFEKFTQADGSMSRRYGGTGLGLTIVKQLVEVMGGKIAVESRVGAGTKFTVALDFPLAPEGEAREEQFVSGEVKLC
jgi:signal transduction histidine kinase